MYLHHIYAQNFRAFGDGASSPILDWGLNRGMNILIGENDAGKTAIIDAIRQVLWTTSFEYVRLFEYDFHVAGTSRADTLVIEVTLRDLSAEQESAVLEWLTYEKDGSRSLILNLQAKRIPPRDKQRGRVTTMVRAGKNGIGPEIGAAVRELVRATYLRPLRDAEAGLKAGRQSRLSQILGAHPLVAEQEKSDFDPSNPAAKPETLVGLVEQAQHYMSEHPVIYEVEKNINDNYLNRMSFTNNKIESEIRIAKKTNLTQILERFELALLPPGSVARNERCPRGLGYNNALFMATELVLLRNGDELGLLLVEEPEAHLHPQLQTRIMELLQQPASKNEKQVQVVMSTHSPSLAAGADIESMTLVHNARTYPLRPECTRLAKTDYEYLRRFIDATKSNLFFARGVAIVEGPTEELLLPAIAEMAGLSFSEYGISVVNVGNVGLYHYARIFQRNDAGELLQIPVACLTDRDIVPDAANSYVQKPEKQKRFESDYGQDETDAVIKRKQARVESPDNQSVKVFVSDYWTFEYDLVRAGLAELMVQALMLAKKACEKEECLDDTDESVALVEAAKQMEALQAKGLSVEALATTIYRPLYEKKVSKVVTAQYAAKLLRSGKYGRGDTLLNALPGYLKRALRHLSGTTDPAPSTDKEPV